MKRSTLEFWGGAIGGAAGAFAILWLIRLPGLDLDTLQIGVLLLAVVPILFIVIGLHEVGHLVAGAAVRFRPCLFILGPVKFERVRADGRWTVGRNRCMPLFGGMTAGIPDTVEDLRRRMALLIAGGPGANLLTGLAALALLVAIRAPAGTRVTWSGADALLYALLLMFCGVSLLTAFAALVPRTTKGYSTDGQQILRFLTKHAEVEAEVALNAFMIASLAGQRPRELDPALVSKALLLPEDSGRGALARLMAHVNALDRGDVERARAYLAEALAHREKVPEMSRPALLLQAALFAALHDGDAKNARQYFDEAGQGALIGPESRWLAEAAVLHVEGKPGVDELLAKAEAALPDTLDRGGARMALDEIAALRARRAAGASVANPI